MNYRSISSSHHPYWGWGGGGGGGGGEGGGWGGGGGGGDDKDNLRGIRLSVPRLLIKIVTMFSTLCLFTKFLPGLREKIQRSRKVSDKKIYHLFTLLPP